MYNISSCFRLMCCLLEVGVPVACGIIFTSSSILSSALSTVLHVYSLHWIFIVLPIYGFLKNLRPLMLQLRFCESVSLEIIDFKSLSVFSLYLCLRLFIFYRTVGFLASSLLLSDLVTFIGPSALRFYPTRLLGTVTFVGAVSLLSRQPNYRLHRSVTQVGVVGLLSLVFIQGFSELVTFQLSA